MYLAEQIINGRKNYIIRTSQYDHRKKFWHCQDLFDLGRSPWEYIEYPGGNAFYIKESVCEQLDDLGVDYTLAELEELFWPFIRKDIRYKIDPFQSRGRRKTVKAQKLQAAAADGIRIFDKRRLYYLRCGVMDQRRITQLPLRYFKGLINKSRDEIEQYILQLEKCLNPREYKLYVYVIFDLQRYFRSSRAGNIPQALDQEELDRYFIRDLCRLHRDRIFWAGFEQGYTLHEYLVRYLVMFFDYDFDGSSAWHDYLQNFINSRRFYRPPAPKTSVTISEIVEIFGLSEEKLLGLTKNELSRLFRQKAHEVHPDKGGDHDDFVRLAEAYKALLQRKG